MTKRFLKKRLGFISIEIVIIAAIVLVSGFTAVGSVVEDGQTASNDAVGKIDEVLNLANNGNGGELPNGPGELPEYGTQTMLEGDGQTYYTLAPSELTFRSEEELSDFQEVLIDGQPIDPSHYTLTEGSTIVTLSIDYLETLGKGDYEITVVSKRNSPNGNFKVIEPEANRYNFYYNQPYTGEVGEETVVFFIRDNGTADTLFVNSTFSENCNYTISGSEITIETSLGVFTGEINSKEEIFFADLGAAFTLGNDAIFADEDYIYFYDDFANGLEANVIDKTKTSYVPIKSNINGIPVVSIERCFLSCENMQNLPEIPSSIFFSSESFAGAKSLKYATIPYGVKNIGDGDFASCESLEKVFIHKGVVNIYGAAFGGTALTDVYYEGTEAEWNAINFSYGNEELLNATIHFNAAGLGE